MLAGCVAAFTFSFSDDPASALPGIHTKDSFWLWCTAHLISLVSFAVLCGHEARNAMHEAFSLRLYWIIEILAWLLPLVVRVDYLATDDLTNPYGSTSYAFYAMSTLACELLNYYMSLCAPYIISVTL